VLENDANEARRLVPPAGAGRLHLAQWNDDIHHALHVLLTGERSGYYADYDPPLPALGRCLTEGFAFQGQRSAYRGRERGEPSGGLPLTAFVTFLQNHDQVGNRAFGERLNALAPAAALRAATAVLLLAPSPPLLFMGQEWAAATPFLFFSDLGPDLGPAVSEGRRREFIRFPQFFDLAARARIPDPQSPETRARSILDWSELDGAEPQAWLRLHRTLLDVRRREIVPLVSVEPSPSAQWRVIGERVIEVEWRFDATHVLRLLANLGSTAVPQSGPRPSWGRRLFALELPGGAWTRLRPGSVACYLGGAT
jgi:malto-oligosyltrehalose trehalohydrolase